MSEKFIHKSKIENSRLDVVPKLFLGQMKLLRAIAAASFVLLPGGSQDTSVEAHTEGLTKVESASKGEVPLLLNDGSVITLPSIENLSVTREIFLPEGQKPDSFIVFVKQVHVSDGFGSATFDYKQEILKLTNESQEVQYEVLRNLVEENVVKSVCSESVRDGDPAVILDYLDTNFTTLQTILLEPYFEEPKESLSDAILKQLSENQVGPELPHENTAIQVKHEITDSILEETRYLMGGSVVLASEGKINLCGAEDSELIEAVANNFFNEDGTLITNFDQERFQEIAFEQREDAALLRAAALGEPVVAVTYGAAHDFTDATVRWNAAHPDNVFGLIVIDPAINKVTEKFISN